MGRGGLKVVEEGKGGNELDVEVISGGKVEEGGGSGCGLGGRRGG